MKEKNSYTRMKNIQKMKFCDNIYITVGDFYRKNKRMPETELEKEEITKEIYESAGLKRLVYEDSVPVVQKKLPGVIQRILKEEAEKKKPKKVKTDAEKRAAKQRRQHRLEKKLRKQMEEERMTIDRDDIFYYIEGYTSWGFPYGVTWEEMGLEPWQDEDESGKEK